MTYSIPLRGWYCTITYINYCKVFRDLFYILTKSGLDLLTIVSICRCVFESCVSSPMTAVIFCFSIKYSFICCSVYNVSSQELRGFKLVPILPLCTKRAQWKHGLTISESKNVSDLRRALASTPQNTFRINWNIECSGLVLDLTNAFGANPYSHSLKSGISEEQRLL